VSQATRDFIQAVFEVDALVKRLEPADWQRPTPCERWSVAQLVRHVAFACCMSAEMARGNPAALPAGTSGASDRPAPLGAGHVWAAYLLAFDGAGYTQGAATARSCWSAQRDDLLEAFDRLDLARPTKSLWGHATLDDWFTFAFVDPLVHSWDLAAAVGSTPFIEEPIAERALVAYRAADANGELRQASTLGPALRPAGESATDRLIAFTGRDLGWRPPSTVG
jgi:uncharacterized protein (TIGR03083 family)